MFTKTWTITDIAVMTSMYSSFQLLKDVQPGDEVEILTGLGKTFLSLDDITQATEVSNEYSFCSGRSLR